MDPIHLLRAIRTNDKSAVSLRIPGNLSPTALATALASNTVTTQLVLSGNSGYSIADLCAILEALSTHPALKSLDCSNMALDAEFLTHVSEFAKYSETLTRLDLSCNYFNEDAAEELGAAICGHRSLRTLVLDQCELKSAGLCAFLAAVTPEKCTLQRLTLSHNKFDVKAAADLSDFVKRNTTLISVNHNGNFVPQAIADQIKAAIDVNAETTKREQLRKTLESSRGKQLGNLLRVGSEVSDESFPCLRRLVEALVADS